LSISYKSVKLHAHKLNSDQPCETYYQYIIWKISRGRRGRDPMVVGFTTTYAISAYHHWCWGRISIRSRCTTLCDKVCQWLATGQWFSPGPPVSSTKKTDRHGTIDILLKVALNTIKQINKHCTYPNTCLLVKKLLPEDDLVNELINTIHTPQPLWKITFEKEKNLLTEKERKYSLCYTSCLHQFRFTKSGYRYLRFWKKRGKKNKTVFKRLCFKIFNMYIIY
jgi:hypothetical protein